MTDKCGIWGDHRVGDAVPSVLSVSFQHWRKFAVRWGQHTC